MSMNKLWIWLLWIVFAGMIYYAMNGLLHPNTAEVLENQAKIVTLKRGLDGHYRAEASINGLRVNVLIDTGATGVAISQRIADKLGLQSHQAIRTSTANGDTLAYLTRLNEVKLGTLVTHDVSATIVPNLEGDVLLGMSFLDRMNIQLHHGIMTIRYGEP